jgi:hypothetical protein
MEVMLANIVKEFGSKSKEGNKDPQTSKEGQRMIPQHVDPRYHTQRRQALFSTPAHSSARIPS